ncbi:MAG TPA: FtsW/RodA/SpoVE family cell cycle protein, partial [Polyangiaceae bacterium]|nr:FtsW/RodA/SpoVE family cell cycle protein [Polyangiaceae bacterium]
LAAEDEFGTHLAFGLSMLFGVQAVVNLGVAMAVLPTKGLTLPFISYGGSSLIVNASAIGILLNISRPRAQKDEQEAHYAPDPDAAQAFVMGAAFSHEQEPTHGSGAPA